MLPNYPILTVSLGLTGSGGAIIRDPDQDSYPSGTEVTLTAVPNAGLIFTGWGGDATGDSNPVVITMDADKTITATFAVPAGTLFSDIADSPYKSAIDYLFLEGIVSGYGDNTFGPEDPVTRQQFAKMIVLTGEYPVSLSDECPFADVAMQMGADPLYPSRYVAVAADRGITVGKTATSFDPYTNITRYQVITMVVRAADDLRPGLLADPPSSYEGTAGWGTDPTHGANALRAEYNGLLDGLDLPSLDPYGNMSRGEVAQVLYNLILWEVMSIL